MGNLGLFYLFRFFKQQCIFATKSKNDPSNVRCRDSNSRRLDHQSPTIATKQGQSRFICEKWMKAEGSDATSFDIEWHSSFLLLCLAILEHLARISPNGMKDVYEILKQQRQTVVEGQYPNFLYDWAELCLQYLDSLGKLRVARGKCWCCSCMLLYLWRQLIGIVLVWWL